MSVEDYDLEDESGSESEGIKSLRTAKAKADKELVELRKELGEFRATQRKNSVAGILKSKGVPEAAAAFYSGDDVSDAAVTNWLTEYADVFNLKQEEKPNPQEDALRKMLAATSTDAERLFSGKQSTTGPITGDPEEILSLLDTLPYEELVKQGLMPKQNIM